MVPAATRAGTWPPFAGTRKGLLDAQSLVPPGSRRSSRPRDAQEENSRSWECVVGCTCPLDCSSGRSGRGHQSSLVMPPKRGELASSQCPPRRGEPAALQQASTVARGGLSQCVSPVLPGGATRSLSLTPPGGWGQWQPAAGPEIRWLGSIWPLVGATLSGPALPVILVLGLFYLLIISEFGGEGRLDLLETPPGSLGPLSLWLCLAASRPAGSEGRAGLLICPGARITPRGGLSSFQPICQKTP